MDSGITSQVISSPTGLKVASLVSVRPRTLGELSELTGISIQGVLKHLKRFQRLGLVEVRKLPKGGMAVRKVYSSRNLLVGDFSMGDLTIVKLSKNVPRMIVSKDPLGQLEYLAEDALIQRRRIREQARKLGRLIDELVGDEAGIRATLESTELEPSERLILQTLFTEDSFAEGERVLSRHYGLKDGRRSIDKALAKAGKIAKK
jgi:DNA-binding transcriptional ArsR family regulator